MTISTQWADRSLTWGSSGPPLIPNQEVIDCFTSLVPPDSNILMLGATQEIYKAYDNITAVDREQVMIDRVWLGDTDTKHIKLDNWLTVDLPSNHFDAVLGDGSINMLTYPYEVEAIVDRCMNWLKPGGRLVCRMFTRPDTPITRERLLAEAANPTVGWTAFRRLVPMVLAHEEGALVYWNRAYEFFNDLFPDRSQLPFTAEQLSRMDAYKGTTTSTWFPTRQEILDLIPGARFVDAGTYDIADTCPILVLEK